MESFFMAQQLNMNAIFYDYSLHCSLWLHFSNTLIEMFNTIITVYSIFDYSLTLVFHSLMSSCVLSGTEAWR